MKNSLSLSVLALALAVTGCASVNPQTGKTETSVGKTAGLGAVVGSGIGALIGGQKGAGLGALVGGGLGALVGYDMRKNELEQALAAAETIKLETGYHPVVEKALYRTGSTQMVGLKTVALKTRAKDTMQAGRLNPKAASAYTKLDQLAKQSGGSLVVAVPKGTPAAVVADIRVAAPNAKLADTNERVFIASLGAAPVQSDKGEIRV